MHECTSRNFDCAGLNGNDKEKLRMEIERVNDELLTQIQRLLGRVQVLEMQVKDLSGGGAPVVPGWDNHMGNPSPPMKNRTHPTQSSYTSLVPTKRRSKSWAEVVQQDLADEFEDDVEGLPESLFSYCIFQMAHAPESTRWKIFMQLFLLVMSEMILAGGYLQSIVHEVITLAWRGPRGTPQSACMFSGMRDTFSPLGIGVRYEYPKSSLHGAWVVIVTGALCAPIIALSFRHDAQQLLRTAIFHGQSDRSHHMCTAIVVFVSTSIHAVWLPCMVAIGIAYQLASCDEVSEIIWNAFAVTFLIQVDDHLYELLLKPDDKARYARMYRNWQGYLGPVERDTSTPDLVCLLDLCVMWFLYFMTRLTDFSPFIQKGQSYEGDLRTRTVLTLVIYMISRCLLFQIAANRQDAGSDNSGGLAGLASSGAAAMGQTLLAIFAICVSMYTVFLPLFGSDTTSPYSTFMQCYNGNITACIC